jgi:hypothetical protein
VFFSRPPSIWRRTSEMGYLDWAAAEMTNRSGSSNLTNFVICSSRVPR